MGKQDLELWLEIVMVRFSSQHRESSLDALELRKLAKAQAGVEGIGLAAQWCRKPILIKLDCARIVQAIQSKSMDKSEIGFAITK